MLTPDSKSIFFLIDTLLTHIGLNRFLGDEIFLPAFVSNKLFFIFPKVFKQLEIHEYFIFSFDFEDCTFRIKIIIFHLKIEYLQ